MPLYEYACRRCTRRFEALVFGVERPVCPGCGAQDLEKLLSTFAVGGEGGRDIASAAGACGSCGDPRGPGSCATDLD